MEHQRLVWAWSTAYELSCEHRVGELLELHARLEVPPLRLLAGEAKTIAWVELYVLLLNRVLPDDVLGRADERLTRISESGVLGKTASDGSLPLALLRLRQRRYDDVERLCQEVQASEGSSIWQRALASAMVQVARQERGQPYDDVVAAAAARGLDSLEVDVTRVRRALGRDQVSADFAEYVASPHGPADRARTDRMLAAYHAGDRVALVHAGQIGAMLRAEGRMAELLELHATFAIPPGPHDLLCTDAMRNLSHVMLFDPDVAAGVIAEAERRVQWITDSSASELQGANGALRRAALRHTMAMVRLRQGRFGEVEALCADVLSLRDVTAEARANAIATVALARRALGLHYQGLLAEAAALDPEAGLVKEARSPSPPAS
jgi:hypothetical protein